MKGFGKNMIKSSVDLNDNAQEITLVGFKNISQDYSNVEYFYNGIYCLYTNNLTEAKKFLVLALNGTEKIEPSYFEYLSYLGLIEVLLHKSRGGLHRCYNAVKGFSTDPQLYLNIAYAEHILGNRRRSIEAIKKSLETDSRFTHAYHLYRCIGRRKKNNLKRTNPAKNILGRFLRRKKNKCTDENFDKTFKNFISKKLDLYIETVINKK